MKIAKESNVQSMSNYNTMRVEQYLQVQSLRNINFVSVYTL